MPGFLELKEHIDKADERTLVVFDVDHVLLRGIDEYDFRPTIRKKLADQLRAKLSAEVYAKRMAIVNQNRKVVVVK